MFKEVYGDKTEWEYKIGRVRRVGVRTKMTACLPRRLLTKGSEIAEYGLGAPACGHQRRGDAAPNMYYIRQPALLNTIAIYSFNTDMSCINSGFTLYPGERSTVQLRSKSHTLLMTFRQISACSLSAVVTTTCRRARRATANGIHERRGRRCMTHTAGMDFGAGTSLSTHDTRMVRSLNNDYHANDAIPLSQAAVRTLRPPMIYLSPPTCAALSLTVHAPIQWAYIKSGTGMATRRAAPAVSLPASSGGISTAQNVHVHSCPALRPVGRFATSSHAAVLTIRAPHVVDALNYLVHVSTWACDLGVVPCPRRIPPPRRRCADGLHLVPVARFPTRSPRSSPPNPKASQLTKIHSHTRLEHKICITDQVTLHASPSFPHASRKAERRSRSRSHNVQVECGGAGESSAAGIRGQHARGLSLSAVWVRVHGAAVKLSVPVEYNPIQHSVGENEFTDTDLSKHVPVPFEDARSAGVLDVDSEKGRH
ncbi:hypothetical protein C8R45DRAFT_947820 [Mycena sanguinolenta]|nr:hypothetical protein C8R45DRAFT_947820 [Mycena sanguinolenta]